MFENIFPNNSPQPQRRTKVTQTVFVCDNDPASAGSESLTEVSALGDVTTFDINRAAVVNGDVVFSPHEIVGQCQVPECGMFLTNRTVRYCSACAAVLCPHCCRWDNREQVFLCPACSKALWWQHFWIGFFGLLTWPIRSILSWLFARR